MPASITEFYFGKSECASMAMKGINYHEIVPFEVRLVYDDVILEHVFTCIISDDRTLKGSIEYCKRSQFNPLHVTFSEGQKGIIKVRDLSFKKIVSHYKREYNKHREMLHPRIREIVDHGIKRPRKHPTINLNLKVRNHNILTPGMCVLNRLKYKFKSNNDPLVGDDSKYVCELVQLGKEIRKIRDRFTKGGKAFSPSIDCILEYPGAFELAPKDGAPIKPTGEARGFINAYNAFVKIEKKRDNYSVYVNGDTFSELMKDDDFVSLQHHRMEELSCYTSAIATMASNYIAPTIRLSPTLKNVRPDLINLRGCLNAKNNARKPSKSNALMRKIANTLSDSVEDHLKNFISSSDRIKIVCDYPIEWLYIDGLPLMISKNTSRLYPVPGNVFLQQGLQSNHLMLSVNELFKVTIIRSFEDNDDLKYVLNSAVSAFNYSNVTINIVDVSSEGELRKALDECENRIVIFDCHGYYNKKNGASYLRIGSDDVDVFSLRKKCKMPPIVILSACETFPLAGRHANVANSFITCGAVSVIGTFFEVDAIRSATIVARLLLRIDMYVPLFCSKCDIPTTWMDIVSGLFRMVYVSDMISEVFRFFKRKDKELEMALKESANTHINSGKKDWFSPIIHDLSMATDVNQSLILAAIEKVCAWSDILSYVHIGHPEKIMINNKSMQDLWSD